ncbi:predicted protein [Nematostella vectensis]|uniref:Uncharacterized protein n=1 Tax=Nematostella vectensis TaxID=45351 RepID=A7SHB0_NEMVE|nr:predicted protein [Nematostella vectensis]|eukprot:XP_001628952.1 predicted protein [Nematostella vectensis]
MPRKQRRRSDKSPLIINQNDTLSSGNDAPVSISSSTGLFKIYKRRWYILGVFTALATVSNMQWNSWGPISQPCQIAFGWADWQILLLSSWIAVSMIVGALPLTWLMDTKVFALAVKPFGIGETKAGWLGCAGTMAGITSGIILARCADYVQHYTKNILMVLFLGTSLAQLFFSMTCSELIPYSEIVLFASIIVGGLFFNGTTPLMFELAMECVYPVAEGITAVLLLVAGNVIYLAFQVAFMFPGVSVKWMNWFTVVATGICVPALLFYKGKMSYFKLGLDEDKREETAKRLNTV